MARFVACWLAGWWWVLPALAGDAPERRPWAEFVERDFPFFSSVVDARRADGGRVASNLTPRGVVLNLGHGCWAVFDLDLLRLAGVWEGGAVTPVSMSQGSYHTAGRKAPEGQDDLPQPAGRMWMANGLFPGAQRGETVSTLDPRDAGDDPREVGKGPLPRSVGRFRSIEIHHAGVTLVYDVAGVTVEETISAQATIHAVSIRRRIRVGPGTSTVWLALGRRSTPEGTSAEAIRVSAEGGDASIEERAEGWLWCRVPSRSEPRTCDIWLERGSGARTHEPEIGERPERESRRRWSEDVVTQGRLNLAPEAYVVDRVPLPEKNPWRRNVRMADLAFLPDGVGYGVTFDGDVWSVRGLTRDLAEVRWRRFASGLHEPLGIAVRDGDVFVHDRNGLWRLRDLDGNGEADRHELFADGLSQTAETREFASGLRLAPDGSFVVGKGGQRGTTLGRHSGCVLRVSKDGERVTVLGHGFRQPFIGVHPTEGWVSVSDQQGHYVPTTPLHLLGGDTYHGFLPLILPKEQHREPIEEPLLWIPHAINASAAGQVWLAGASMGPATDGLIHLGYYRPEVFSVMLDGRQPRRGAALVSLTRDLDFAPLAGTVGPLDGQLYVTGFQIWGSTAKETSGLARVRYTGRESLFPMAVETYAEGILLRFTVELDRDWAADPANYSLERWNYRRSAEYGSAHYRLTGEKGQEPCMASLAYVSQDGRSVFLGVPDMRASMQMRVGWGLRTRDGIPLARSAYLTPRDFPAWDSEAAGFGQVRVDLTRRVEAVRPEAGPRDANEGQRVAEMMGCVACHSTDGSTLGKVGPTWKGLWGSLRSLADGSSVDADSAYLRESIREPAARVVSGYQATDTGMPSYEGVLTEAQIEALIRYLETLK